MIVFMNAQDMSLFDQIICKNVQIWNYVSTFKISLIDLPSIKIP